MAIEATSDCLPEESPEEKEQAVLDVQRAMTNILEDMEDEKLRLEDTQKATLNILEDIKQTEEELRATMGKLERSNDELQQFAYVASHDLQEPLRMIASFLQLLYSRYSGKLDSDAKEFIDFAVDGANRMQAMINDLLLYSRVGTRGKDFSSVDCEQILHKVLDTLQITIRETGARVTYGTLPVIEGDQSQMNQLFQNLISNAIKFRGERPPQIHVQAERAGGEWRFSVSDNGIGIDPEFRDRIFIIFQRLHGNTEYPGTGIGLAVCKRIIERHGGRLWVESKPGEGSTFYFTIRDDAGQLEKSTMSTREKDRT